MIELWGSDECEECNKARVFLGQSPIEWKYVDVAETKYEGFIPILKLEDGNELRGLPAIKQYVNMWMKKMGMI